MNYRTDGVKVTLRRIIPDPRGYNELRNTQLVSETPKNYIIWLPLRRKRQLIPKSEWCIVPLSWTELKENPIIQQALTNLHRLYLDDGGNYHLYPQGHRRFEGGRGPIAPYNKELKKALRQSGHGKEDFFTVELNGAKEVDMKTKDEAKLQKPKTYPLVLMTPEVWQSQMTLYDFYPTIKFYRAVIYGYDCECKEWGIKPQPLGKIQLGSVIMLWDMGNHGDGSFYKIIKQTPHTTLLRNLSSDSFHEWRISDRSTFYRSGYLSGGYQKYQGVVIPWRFRPVFWDYLIRVWNVPKSWLSPKEKLKAKEDDNMKPKDEAKPQKPPEALAKENIMAETKHILRLTYTRAVMPGTHKFYDHIWSASADDCTLYTEHYDQLMQKWGDVLRFIHGWGGSGWSDYAKKVARCKDYDTAITGGWSKPHATTGTTYWGGSMHEAEEVIERLTSYCKKHRLGLLQVQKHTEYLPQDARDRKKRKGIETVFIQLIIARAPIVETILTYADLEPDIFAELEQYRRDELEREPTEHFSWYFYPEICTEQKEDELKWLHNPYPDAIEEMEEIKAIENKPETPLSHIPDYFVPLTKLADYPDLATKPKDETKDKTLDSPEPQNAISDMVSPETVDKTLDIAEDKKETIMEEETKPVAMDGKVIALVGDIVVIETTYKGKQKIDVRQLYENGDGAWHPSKQGIRLTKEQWVAILKALKSP